MNWAAFWITLLAIGHVIGISVWLSNLVDYLGWRLYKPSQVTSQERFKH